MSPRFLSTFFCFIWKVADLHGELLEFNERLHKQVGYYQLQVRRLREELVNLRGPVSLGNSLRVGAKCYETFNDPY